MTRNLWTHEETMLAFYVFCNIPFKNSSKNNPIVVEYARLLPGRTPSALNMKIGNLGRYDLGLQAQGISGLRSGGAMDETVWDEFRADPEAFMLECHRIIARRKASLGLPTSSDDTALIAPDNGGQENFQIVRTRLGQDFFRSTVCSAYAWHCCATRLGGREIVEACHIVPWADDKANRLNPSNGLCLSATMHKAYDANLMAVTPDGLIAISERLLSQADSEQSLALLRGIDGTPISMPEKFAPAQDLLARHYEQYLAAN